MTQIRNSSDKLSHFPNSGKLALLNRAIHIKGILKQILKTFRRNIIHDQTKDHLKDNAIL